MQETFTANRSLPAYWGEVYERYQPPNNEGLQSVALISATGLQARLLGATLEQHSVCRVDLIEPHRLAAYHSRSNGWDLCLIDWIKSPAEQPATSWQSKELQELGRVALLNVPVQGDILSLMHAANLVGVMPRNTHPGHLVQAVKTMLRGDCWFPRNELSRFVVQTRRALNVGRNLKKDTLTDKERTVLSALAEGSTNEGIARKLFISQHTVKTHLYNLYRKLGVNNRVEAALWAHRNLVATEPAPGRDSAISTNDTS